MITPTVGADAATETLSASLPSNDTSTFLDTMPPTSSFPIATTMAMAMAMTTESGEMECLYERAVTPKSHESHDGCQIESSSTSTWDPLWWEMIPVPPALLLWPQCITVTIWSVYAFAKRVLGYIKCRSQPRDSTDLETRPVFIVIKGKESGTFY